MPAVSRLASALGASLRIAAKGGNLQSLALATRPAEMLSYLAESLFLYRTMTGTRGLQQRNVFSALKTARSIDVKLANLDGDTWFQPVASYANDLLSLCMLCQIVQPKLIFEIGTLTGYTALHFALNTPKDTKILTLDLPRRENAEPALEVTMMDEGHIRHSVNVTDYCFDGYAESSKIECLFGDSATFDYSPFKDQVGLFFIDGAHSYEYAKSDTMAALSCCTPGSVIAWHDYGRVGVNGVSRWLHEFRASGRPVFAVPGGSLAYMKV